MNDPPPSLASPDTEDPASPYEGYDLCPCCLHENPDDALLCHKCGAPVDSLTTYVPYTQILAEGFLYRQATTNCTNRITLTGIWILFLPQAAGFLFLLAPPTAEPALASIYLAYATISLAILIRATRSYFRNHPR